jgi:hypothetical protein
VCEDGSVVVAMTEGTTIDTETWEKAQRQAEYERDMKLRMQAAAKNELISKQKKMDQSESEWKDFVNDRGEMRRLRGHIVATKMVRNPMMELRTLESNREQAMLYAILVGAVLLLVAFGL